MRWTEAFIDFLSRIVGARKIHLAYVVRTTHNADYDASFELTNDTSHTEDDGSLKEDIKKGITQSSII